MNNKQAAQGAGVSNQVDELATISVEELCRRLGTTVVTLVLILIAFQVQRLRILARTIAKLDELLELLRDTRRELSPTESKQVMQELAQIRARLLQDSSLKRPKP
jgi:low affinity Fe/Cu permease